MVAGRPGLAEVMAGCLGPYYQLTVVDTIDEARRRLATGPRPDLVLLTPEGGGDGDHRLCLELKAAPETWAIPLVMVSDRADPAEQARGLTVGAADFLTGPFHPDLVRARIDQQLELCRHKEQLEHLVAVRSAEVLRARDDVLRIQEGTLIAIAALAETRDPETGHHLQRTQRYVQLLAVEAARDPRFAAELTPGRIDMIHKSAPLHDIGKVGIADRILLKPGRLTDEEFAEVKKHTLYGWNALKSANRHIGSDSFLRLAAEIALTHHERWDGTGYPRGLKGEAIPLPGRLMALADVYDALISRRVYKPALSHAEAVAVIAGETGRHFDPGLVAAFLRIETRVAAVALEMDEYVI
jgi:putative two-component system response regulator